MSNKHQLEVCSHIKWEVSTGKLIGFFWFVCFLYSRQGEKVIVWLKEDKASKNQQTFTIILRQCGGYTCQCQFCFSLSYFKLGRENDKHSSHKYLKMNYLFSHLLIILGYDLVKIL